MVIEREAAVIRRWFFLWSNSDVVDHLRCICTKTPFFLMLLLFWIINQSYTIHSVVLFLFFALSLSLVQNLRKMEGETQEPVKDLDELQNSDWVRGISPCYTSRFISVTMLWKLHILCMFTNCHYINRFVLGPTRHGSGCRWCETYEMALS